MSKSRQFQLGAVVSPLLLSIGSLIGPITAHGATTATTISTPTNGQVKATGSSYISLVWSASTDSSGTGDVPAYSVYNGSDIVATSMSNSVTVSSLTSSTSYTLSVQAYDGELQPTA